MHVSIGLPALKNNSELQGRGREQPGSAVTFKSTCHNMCGCVHTRTCMAAACLSAFAPAGSASILPASHMQPDPVWAPGMMLHLNGLGVCNQRDVALGALQQGGRARQRQRQHRSHLWHAAAHWRPARVHVQVRQGQLRIPAQIVATDTVPCCGSPEGEPQRVRASDQLLTNRWRAAGGNWGLPKQADRQEQATTA